MPSLTTVKNFNKETNSGQLCQAGLIRLNRDELLDEIEHDHDKWLQRLHEDTRDFEELKLSLNTEELEFETNHAYNNSLYADPQFYDV